VLKDELKHIKIKKGLFEQLVMHQIASSGALMKGLQGRLL
jgi:hypothetical protein